MNTLNDALKPCAHCGSAPSGTMILDNKMWLIECHECGATTKQHYSEDRSISAWNTRSNTPESSAAQGAMTFQERVQPWMMECFGAEISADRMERNHRFFEEATELVQANGMTRSEAHQLVDYTFSRPIGEPSQEVGGVMVTLAALCGASELDMHTAAETELTRINQPEIILKIRAKQAAKPHHSPLPEVAQPSDATAQPRVDLTDEQIAKHLAEHGIGYIRLAKDATWHAEPFAGYDAEIYGNAIRALLANTAQGKPSASITVMKVEEK